MKRIKRIVRNLLSRNSIDDLSNRLEFVREEILFELRVKSGNFKDKDNQIKIESKIIDSSKLDQGIDRINIGCGHIQPEGYINVDGREIPGVDIVCSASDLIFDDASLGEIFNSHLVEHFTELELKRVIFPHWFLKLKNGGKLRIIVPDAQGMIFAYTKNEMSFEDLKKVTFGAQDYEGDFHYIMFTYDTLKELLEGCGFEKVSLVEDNRVNGLCREMEVIAYKPMN